jgi:hypothetical protein
MRGIETWVSSEAVLPSKFILGYTLWPDRCMQTTRNGNLEDQSVEHKTCRLSVFQRQYDLNFINSNSGQLPLT